MIKSILETAEELVGGTRGEEYGHPLRDFSDTSKIWSVILGCDVSPEQVALCMIGVKISRLCHTYKLDSVVDIAGYARTLQMVHDEKEKRLEKSAQMPQ